MEESIKDGRTGLYLASGNPDDPEAKLRRATSHPAERHSTGARARKVFREELSAARRLN